MTGRDRIVLVGVIVLVILAGAWMEVVSPERQQASKLGGQVAAARTKLSTSEGQLQTARTAQSQYAAAYASVVSLGKAVPPTQEVPSLIYQLSQATDQKRVQFTSIVTGASSGSGSTASTSTSTSTSTSASTTASQPGAALSAFTQMPFTFVFEGSFFDLEHLFRTLTGFTTNTVDGALAVSGRLLTIQSVRLTPRAAGASEPGKSTGEELTGTITATAYVLPASQGLTGSATSTSPTGAAPAASTTGASSSPTAPAIVRVNP